MRGRREREFGFAAFAELIGRTAVDTTQHWVYRFI
jgi:hypothetical protein